MFDLTPIDVLKRREVSTLPPHFSKIKLEDTVFFDEDLKQWVKNKLKGRFCILRVPNIEDDKLHSSTVIAFEDHKELTYFMLACPYLRRN